MTRLLVCTLVLASLAGCATPGAQPYGNFIGAAPAAEQQQLAQAAVQQLVALYPPGSTRFALQQAASDAFGQSLTTDLRARGYALQDFRAEANTPPATEATATAPTPASAAAGTPLAYVLDQAAGPGRYRISLTVGNQTLTRVYQMHEGRPAPAGAWVRKE